MRLNCIMMKMKCFFLMIATIALGCTSIKKALIQSGGRNEVIQNAILDFSKTRLYKKDTIFSVKTGDMDKNVLTVRIGKNSTKLLLTANTKVGSHSKLPSRFIEKEGKLFFWWDDDYPLTEEALAIYKKYHLLQDDEGGIITVPDFIINDAQKAAHYYFCWDDLSIYKKVITNKGIGYYKPPKLKCSQ
jgi:hypothetical protein